MRIFIALRIHETEVLGVFSTLEKALAVKPDAVDEYEIDSIDRVMTYSPAYAKGDIMRVDKHK